MISTDQFAVLEENVLAVDVSGNKKPKELAVIAENVVHALRKATKHARPTYIATAPSGDSASFEFPLGEDKTKNVVRVRIESDKNPFSEGGEAEFNHAMLDYVSDDARIIVSIFWPSDGIQFLSEVGQI